MLGPKVPGRLLRLPHGDPALHWLLGAVGLLVFVGEPLRSIGFIGGWPQALLLAAILVVGLLGLKSPTRLTWPILLLGPLVLLALALTDIDSPPFWRIAGGLLTALALALLAVALLRQVLADGRVTVARIEGAISLYLLAALVFAHVYGALEMANAGAFTLGTGNEPVQTLDRRFLYFSLITQTSTGFGDVAPVHHFARSVVALRGVLLQASA